MNELNNLIGTFIHHPLFGYMVVVDFIGRYLIAHNKTGGTIAIHYERVSLVCTLKNHQNR